MNQKILIVAGVIMVGLAAFFLVPTEPKQTNRSGDYDILATAPDPETAREVEALRLPAQQELFVRSAGSVAAAPPVSAWARLAEKYGPEKMALSSKITSNLTSVINDGIELANIAARNSGSSSIAEAASKEILRNAAGRLALTEDQQAQAGGVIQSAVNRRLLAVSDLTHAMSTEPTQIMEMLLAGDALARGQLSQADYDNITLPTREMLQNMSSFIIGQPGAGGASQLLMDAETAAQLNAILTPEQQVKLAEMTATVQQQVLAREAARARSNSPFQIGQIPVMELGQLDQTIGSVQQMAQAARLMMDAMQGLKEAKAAAR
jgi:hypothetical protein